MLSQGRTPSSEFGQSTESTVRIEKWGAGGMLEICQGREHAVFLSSLIEFIN